MISIQTNQEKQFWKDLDQWCEAHDGEDLERLEEFFHWNANLSGFPLVAALWEEATVDEDSSPARPETCVAASILA